MIREKDTFYIGKISKVRGLCGEVELLFTDDAFERGTAEYLLLEMEGLPVPFHWTEYRFKNDRTAIFQFEDVDSEEAARRLVGAKVFYPKAALPEEEEEAELSSWQVLIGFTLYDREGRIIGVVESVDESSANILLTVRSEDGEECYLPLHEDFLLELRRRDRVLITDYPEELLTLNKKS